MAFPLCGVSETMLSESYKGWEGKNEKFCSASLRSFSSFFLYSKNYMCTNLRFFTLLSCLKKKKTIICFLIHNSEGRYFTYISAHTFVVRENTFSIVIKP